MKMFKKKNMNNLKMKNDEFENTEEELEGEE